MLQAALKHPVAPEVHPQAIGDLRNLFHLWWVDLALVSRCGLSGRGVGSLGWNGLGLSVIASMRSCLLVLWLANVLAGAIALSNPALAGSFTVTNTNDSGPGSLRDTIMQ